MFVSRFVNCSFLGSISINFSKSLVEFYQNSCRGIELRERQEREETDKRDSSDRNNLQKKFKIANLIVKYSN